ncbi:unnamed protein product [Arctia plantaginis]|uniref:alpha-glucosidase n=1 Tax=Arctia plantaginis TaxID=874455 RepID=A0A8S0ZET7_ARCPL|nr:unnamed protein product [Arctia plantaginis]
MKCLCKAAIVIGVLGVLGVIAGLVAWVVIATRNDPPPEIIPLEWWQHCTLYQIYPRSFKDSNADGIGDLQGIISELQHFADSGVDAIWMSPIFESPMIDFGYDISNYYKIHYEYGDIEDFDELLNKAHELGIKVLLDFVPNHASTQSHYFIESEANNPRYRDYFMWDDGLEDPNNASNRLPPSNWVSQFGGSAWQWSDARQQFYLHQFAIEQGDFNFTHQPVRDEMFNIMRFWLDKGVDGFRLDALPYLFEANPADHGGRYPDDPLSGLVHIQPNERGYTIPLYTKDLIEIYDVVHEWRDFIDRYNEEHGGDTRVIFSEGYANISMTMLYYGNEYGYIGAHFPFNFDFITDVSAESNARDLVYTVLKWLTHMPQGAAANWQFGNHDNSRMPSRFRIDMVDGLNSLNMMLPGASVTYQGEEIGMRDGYVSWNDTVDVEALQQGNESNYMEFSRDPARTPFHWDNSTNAGFSTGNRTWLPIAGDYMELNLAKQKEDDRSHYKVYQALTRLRKTTTLIHGDYNIRAFSNFVFYLIRYLRTFDTYVLVFNVGERTETVDLNRVPYLTLPATVYVSSINSTRVEGTVIDYNVLTLAGGEALVLQAPPV